MKTKIMAMMAVFLACGSLNAQYYNEYYHRIGDTVDYKSDIGYYMWWGLRDLLRNNHLATEHDEVGSGVFLAPYFTAAPLKIIGIAGCPMSSFPWEIDVDTTTKPEYFYLYDNGTSYGRDNPVFLKRIRWYLPDPHRWLKYETVSQRPYVPDSCCSFDTPYAVYRRLYECYFDTAVYVTDTFYVGWSYHSNYDLALDSSALSPGWVPPTTVTYAAWTSGSFYPCYEDDTLVNRFGEMLADEICFFPIFDHLICLDTSLSSNPANPNLQWESYRTKRFVLVYPIIEIDTTVPPFYICDSVQNVQVATDGDSCAVVTWDDFYNYTYCDVQWFAAEQGYGTAQTQTVVGSNMLRICDLDSTMTYYVRVRAFCDTSKIETSWTRWTQFSFANEGIGDNTSLLSTYTHLEPNPATDRVTVMSSFGLTYIEVYSVSGVLVYSEPAGFSSAVIDLRGWAPGNYIMMIHTPQGVTAKRLAVVR